MPKACREYISVHASKARVENYDTIQQIVADLKPIIAGKRAGYQVLPLYTLEDVENENLDTEQVLAASNGRIPVIFVNVTFRTEELSAADFAAWETSYDLRLLQEYVSTFSH